MRLDGEVAGLFLFNLGLGLCFTVLLTAPAVRFFDTHIFGYPHDGFEYVWRMWWTRKALLDLRVTPAQMSYINYPYLDYNPHLVASPLIGLLALPFVGWLGPLRTYNALLFLSFALSWPTGALLCREFTRERLSASVGGALYAFHANRVAHAIGGHLPHAFTFLFPLMALLLYRVWRTPGRRRALWSGLVLALVLLIDLKHVALFVAPFVAVFLTFFGLCERHLWTRERLLALAVAFGVGALIVVPFFAPLVAGRLSGQLAYFYAPGAIRHSADVLGFIVPSPEHPLYRYIPGLYAVAERLALPGWHENIFYLGWIGVALAIVGAVARWQQLDTRFWVVTALVGLVLALGPVLKVNGEVVSWRLGQTMGVIPLPYALLQALPFYDWGRTPGGVVTVTMLALAVLTALGTATILTRLRARALRAPVMLLIIVLVGGDQIYTWPWPGGEAEGPAVVGIPLRTVYALLCYRSRPSDCGRLDAPPLAQGRGDDAPGGAVGPA